MNWYKAKTILIVFFLILNLFLIFNIAGLKNNNYIREDIILYTVDILDKSNIEIEPNIIPKKINSIKNFNVVNSISDYNEFAKKILGDSVTKTDEVYNSKKGTVSFNGDSFNIILKNKYSEIVSKSERAKKILNDIGINADEALFSEKKDNVIIKMEINKLPIYQNEICFDFSGDDIKINGVWFTKDKSSNGTSQLKPATSALIDMISSNEFDKKKVVKNMTLGYMIYDTETFHISMTPIPVWKVEFTDNKSILIDARANT